jgi:uncharacterized coiled-coil protein SlyX
MTLEERVAALEASWCKQDRLVKHLREAVDVTAALEIKQSRVAKQMAEEMASRADWLRSHHQSIADHKEWLKSRDQAMKSHDQAMKDLDARITKLVSGIGELILRKQ